LTCFLETQLDLSPSCDVLSVQICCHAEARQQELYYTMSPAGVTTYAGYGSPLEFVSLDTWQREYFVHKHLMQLTVFRHYR